ncbi:H/ACA ribonucleoprotein complex non-core subunit NAF1-like isoform X1 [Sinocyclocheilus rhinocerous]|uniref:H/ACA ribonucleoprotein complex non-core subunit NAF1 n=1 Tax=Sinocyclocheilus rhinocerous TaxID=307959 RepID=A0A673K7Z4_9TELE|nr:PREDICTED: H/ACA ribonucleoprotein complex non-core subunit NAF1-like isoform X1 [Sinocyclocheilus rhinocerous]
MENSSTENVTDGQNQDQESEKEKMELDINNTPFQTENTCDQNFGSQLGPTDEPCTSGQSEQLGDQCSRGQLEPPLETFTSDQSGLTRDRSSSGELGPTAEPFTSDQSGLTGGQSSSGQLEPTSEAFMNDQSEQTGDQGTGGSSGLAADHCTSIQSDQTGDQSSSGQLGPTGEPLTSNQSGLAGNQISSIQIGPEEIQSGIVVSPHSGTGSLGLLSMQYRGNSSDDNCSDSDSDSSSSSSSSSTSSSSEPFNLVMNNAEDDDEGVAMGNEKKPAPLKTQNELLIEDLPAVENLHISLPEDTEMKSIGTISSVVEQLVIVESYKNTPPLNEDSVLFTKNRTSIGKIFEVFGPVCQPYYVLRFNSHDDIDQKDLKIRDTVYFAPKIKDFTDYIFTQVLQKTKGSDASWKNDQEPPPEALDFSDDEQERLSKQKLKEHKRRPQNDSDSEDESDAHKGPPPHKSGRRKPRQNRNVPRGQHHNRGGAFHSNYHARPPFPPDYMFPPPDPHMFPFQGPMMPPFPRPPPFQMGMALWPPGPNQGFMFQPPPPPPPPPHNQ